MSREISHWKQKTTRHILGLRVLRSHSGNPERIHSSSLFIVPWFKLTRTNRFVWRWYMMLSGDCILDFACDDAPTNQPPTDRPPCVRGTGWNQIKREHTEKSCKSSDTRRTAARSRCDAFWVKCPQCQISELQYEREHSGNLHRAVENAFYEVCWWETKCC